jgi:TetR/AcrR family fatty acid metabolism transcriptional regulator
MEYSRKQQKIIDATIDIIIREGIDRVTTRRIAKELGITDPALYNHFESKEAILAAVCDLTFQEYDKAWNQIDMLEGKGLERVRQVFLSRCKIHDQNPRISYIQLNGSAIFKNASELSKKFAEYLQRDEEFTVSLIKEAQKTGEARTDISARDLSQVISGAFLDILVQWLSQGSANSLYEQGKRIWNAIVTLTSPPSSK